MEIHRVKLESARGVVERCLVKDAGDMILVCREDELTSAEKEGRNPIAVAFPKKYIVK